MNNVIAAVVIFELTFDVIVVWPVNLTIKILSEFHCITMNAGEIHCFAKFPILTKGLGVHRVAIKKRKK